MLQFLQILLIQGFKSGNFKFFFAVNVISIFLLGGLARNIKNKVSQFVEKKNLHKPLFSIYVRRLITSVTTWIAYFAFTFRKLIQLISCRQLTLIQPGGGRTEGWGGKLEFYKWLFIFKHVINT